MASKEFNDLIAQLRLESYAAAKAKQARFAAAKAKQARSAAAKWQGCEWFYLCDNEATSLQDHPVAGEASIPICGRCRAFAAG